MKQPGELGSVSVEQRKTGLRLRARIRDDAGKLHRIGATAASYDEAHAKLLALARSITTSADSTLSLNSTIADLSEVWLEDVRISIGNIKTVEQYTADVRTVVIPTCGALKLGTLSVGRLTALLRHVQENRSPSTARRLRKLLSMILGVAVRHDVLSHNPIRDVPQLPGTQKKESYLTPQQFAQMCDLARVWLAPNGRKRVDRAKLIDVACVMVGTSARIGEVLALRRSDVDLSGYPGVVRIAATLQQTKAEGLTRKPTPKHARQTRSVVLPPITRDALLRRLERCGGDPNAYLFATKTGAAYSVSNFQRLIRDFRDAHQEQLESFGINTDEFTTHLFRRTAATWVERQGGITLASRLLGHANESITRASYVVSDEQVDPETADIIGRLFPSPEWPVQI